MQGQVMCLCRPVEQGELDVIMTERVCHVVHGLIQDLVRDEVVLLAKLPGCADRHLIVQIVRDGHVKDVERGTVSKTAGQNGFCQRQCP